MASFPPKSQSGPFVQQAMVLMVAKVDPDIIQILGCWRLDEMFHYLHIIAELIMKNFALRMLPVDYTLAPS